MEVLIEGVVISSLKTFFDERGFFREVMRMDNKDLMNDAQLFAQINHSKMHTGIAKAWHYHSKQTDFWYVVSGVMKVGLYDIREDSPTHRASMVFMMGDDLWPQVVKIPPGVAHGCKAIQGPVHFIYAVDRVYDPEDEKRLPYDIFTEVDWEKMPLIN